MRNAVMFVVLLLYALINYYVGNRFLSLLQLIRPFRLRWFWYLPFAFFACTSAATFVFSSKNLKWVGKIGNYWLAVMVLAFVLFGLTDLVLLAVRLLRKTELSRSVVGASRLAAAAAALLLLAFGLRTASNVRLTKYEVTIEKDTSLDSLKLVLFSDLHLGYVNDHEKLAEIVAKINETHPDIVVISGDFFDGNYNAVQQPKKVAEELRKIEATYGVYLAWGNHDAGDTFEEMRQLALDGGITLLEDEAVTIADAFVLAGRRDSFPLGEQGGSRADMSGRLAEFETGLPVIVLDHQPSNIDEYENVDLILCGHTHQGQIFPINLITDRLFKVDYGYYREGAKQVVVSSGIATWGPPIRLGTKSELVEITVRFGAE